VVVVSGLAHKTADNAGVHSMSPPTWLSGVRPSDKEAAVRAGRHRRSNRRAEDRTKHAVPFIELATEDHSGLIDRATAAIAAPISTRSLAHADDASAHGDHPRAVFERLFGEGGTPEQRVARLRQDRSILDAVTQQAGRLKMSLGRRTAAPSRSI